PTTAQHVEDGLKERVDLILDGGPCEIGVESTVLSLVHDTPTILRPGVITKEQLSEALSLEVQELVRPPVPADHISPGMSMVHYAPRTKLRMVEDFKPDFASGRIGLIAFKAYEDDLQ